MNNRRIKRPIRANEDVVVDETAVELLFETEDVAELVAEVTGVPVEVSAEGETVTFSVGEGDEVEEFIVEAEGDEEFVEASSRISSKRRPVQASRRLPTSQSKGRTIKKFPSSYRR